MNEPSVSAEEVRHAARLARVDLDDEEVESFREEFAEILAYFDRLEAVPDRDRDEADENVLRSDVIEESLPVEEALRNAADTEDGYFKGPPVS